MRTLTMTTIFFFDFSRDSQQEASRKRKLDEYKVSGVWPSKKHKPKKSEPWSKNKALLEKKKLKREKRQRQKLKKKKEKLTEEEIKEINEDAALLKKSKKMTKKAFLEEFCPDLVKCD